jgi:hypothetical protein
VKLHFQPFGFCVQLEDVNDLYMHFIKYTQNWNKEFWIEISTFIVLSLDSFTCILYHTSMW